MSFLMRRGIVSSAIDTGGTIFAANTSLLNGTDQYYSTPHNAVLDSSDVTVCAWVKLTTTSTFDNLITKHTTGDRGFILQSDPTNGLRFFASNDGLAYQTIPTVTGMVAGTWYFVVGRVTSTTAFVRYSSVNTDSLSHTGGINAANTGLTLGSLSVPNFNRTQGSIAFVKVYNRALSDAELDELEAADVVCTADLPSNLQNGLIYAPRLANFDVNVGEELDDQSPSGIVTTAFGSPTYTDQGLTVECS